MKSKLVKQALCMTLAAASIFSLAACGKEAETTAPTQAAVAVPQREEPDRANLLYLSAIEPYCKADWTANWIWTKSCSDDSYVVFRKTVTADAAMEATAYISAVDKYVLWLNGELVVLDGSLKRGPTPYDSYYDEIKLNLKEGENTIAMLPQPFVTSAMSQVEGLRVALDMNEEWQKVAGSKLVTGVLVVRKDAVENDPEAFAAFMDGYAASVEAANSDLEGTAALCEQYGVVAKAALAQKALPQCNIVFETGDEMKTDLETYFKVLYAADPASVGGALPADDFYYAG